MKEKPKVLRPSLDGIFSHQIILAKSAIKVEVNLKKEAILGN